MLHIGDGNFLSYLKAREKYNLSDLLNEKKFRVSDTPLSYRQINTLDKNNIIKDKRKSNKQWRKFSFKELVFFLLVQEVRKYGLGNEELKHLRDSFFKEPTSLKNKKAPLDQNNKSIGEIAVSLAFSRQQIILTINNKYETDYYTLSHFLLFGNSISEHNTSSFIFINLNEIVNDLLKRLGKKGVDYKSMSSDFLENMVSDKEKELIGILRDNDYKTIKIKKKNGEIYNIYGEKENNNKEFTDKDLLSVLKGKDFQNISIQKRDGKIVSLKAEDVYKIK